MMAWLTGSLGRTPPAQVFVLGPGTYQWFEDYVGPHEQVDVSFEAEGWPVDVFFIDDHEFRQLREHHVPPPTALGRGRFKYLGGALSFHPTYSGLWRLVIGNPNSHAVNVTVRAATRLAPAS